MNGPWSGSAGAFDAVGDVTGKIVVVDFESPMWWMSMPDMEAGLRGAAAVILTYNPDWPGYFGQQDALAAFDAETDLSAPPMVWISWKHGDTLKEALGVGPLQATVKLNAPLTLIEDGGRGYNVVGKIKGTTNKNEYVVFGGHHDAWFEGGLDNASSVVNSLVDRQGHEDEPLPAQAHHGLPQHHRRGVRPHQQLVRLVRRRLALHHAEAPELGGQDRRHAQHRDRGLQEGQPLDAREPRGHADARGADRRQRRPHAHPQRHRPGRHRRAVVLERPVDLHRRRRAERLVLVAGQRLQRRLQDDHLPHPVRHGVAHQLAVLPRHRQVPVPRGQEVRQGAPAVHARDPLHGPRRRARDADRRGPGRADRRRRHRQDGGQAATTSTSTPPSTGSPRPAPPTTTSRATSRPPTGRRPTPSSCASRS